MNEHRNKIKYIVGIFLLSPLTERKVNYKQ